MAILYSRLFSLVQITSHLGKIYSELLCKVQIWVAIVTLAEVRAYMRLGLGKPTIMSQLTFCEIPI